MDEKTRLKEIILQYSYQKKKVKLSSGLESDFYFDGKQSTLHPEGAFLVGSLFYQSIRQYFPHAQAVGGPTLGADPICTAVAIASYLRGAALPAFIVRKNPKVHGTQSWIEGARHLKAGMRVVVVEDVITTGASILKAVDVMRNFGLVVVGCVVLVDRQEGGEDNLEQVNLPLRSIFTKAELLN